MIKNIDNSTESERVATYQERQKEKEERVKKENAIAARQRGFIPRTKAKPRPKFPKTSQIVSTGQARARQLNKQYGGDYAKFRAEVLKTIQKHEAELKRKRRRA